VSSGDTQRQKAAAFAALHAGEPFVIPNPWDAGSARMLAALGFPALATTSSGFAFTLGRRDGRMTLDEAAAHIAELDQATGLPVSADLENGYGADPESAARAVTVAAGAGAVGGSIEDYDRAEGIYHPRRAAERVAAAAEAARGLSFPFLLTARAENHIRGNPDLADTITRLQAYQEAGADVLYAPGLRSPEDIRAVCAAVDRPVNVLAVRSLPLAEIFAAGARRVSLGGSLAWSAVGAAAAAAAAIRDHGDLAVHRAVRLPCERTRSRRSCRHCPAKRRVGCAAQEVWLHRGRHLPRVRRQERPVHQLDLDAASVPPLTAPHRAACPGMTRNHHEMWARTTRRWPAVGATAS
jgi:2-methylisocitrate lyase-like PEP mutase family enzyme